jgi:hypothetical protein
VLVAIVAGFSMAAASLFLASQQQTGAGQLSSAGPVSGLSYDVTILNVTPEAGALPLANGLGSPTQPVALTGGTNAFCVSGGAPGASPCVAGDLGEWVEYRFTTSLGGALAFEVALRANGTVTSQPVYLAQSSPQPASGTILLVWDLGRGDLALDGVSVAVDQCAAPTSCP